MVEKCVGVQRRRPLTQLTQSTHKNVFSDVAAVVVGAIKATATFVNITTPLSGSKTSSAQESLFLRQIKILFENGSQGKLNLKIVLRSSYDHSGQRGTFSQEILTFLT
jgi:hypothetical protein